MNELIYEDLDNFINEFTSDKRFLRLIELNKIIKVECGLLISEFKRCEDEYNKALPYKAYLPDFSAIQASLAESKAKLYQNKYVVEYKAMEREISNELDLLSNDLAKSISNKFNLKTVIG